VAGLLDGPGESKAIYTGTLPDSHTFPSASSAALGAGALLHSTADTMYASAYDGSVDVPLESGVTGFYDPSMYESAHGLR
jgi:hypothetical protein